MTYESYVTSVLYDLVRQTYDVVGCGKNADGPPAESPRARRAQPASLPGPASARPGPGSRPGPAAAAPTSAFESSTLIDFDFFSIFWTISYLRLDSQMVCIPAVVFSFSSIAVEKPKLIDFDLMLLQTGPTFTYSFVDC